MAVSILADMRNRLAQIWFRFRRPMTLGVRVLAFDGAGRVCLVRHTYTPGWHLPGGGVERGETCRQAAGKELREETGLIAEPAALRLVSVHANFESFPGDHVTVWHAVSWSPQPESGQRASAGEIAEWGFFDVQSLPPGTTGGTRARIAEHFGRPSSDHWRDASPAQEA